VPSRPKLRSVDPTGHGHGVVVLALSNHEESPRGRTWKGCTERRGRSLITAATLIALYRTDQMANHMRRAIENGDHVPEPRDVLQRPEHRLAPELVGAKADGDVELIDPSRPYGGD
jgi:hypothetical protein